MTAIMTVAQMPNPTPSTVLVFDSSSSSSSSLLFAEEPPLWLPPDELPPLPEFGIMPDAQSVSTDKKPSAWISVVVYAPKKPINLLFSPNVCVRRCSVLSSTSVAPIVSASLFE